MLAGVGGKTIAEAKDRLSYAEYLQWLAYRQKHGPLSLQLRQEKIAAAQMLQLNRANGGKGQLSDYMLFTKQEDQELTLEEAMEQWV